MANPKKRKPGRPKGSRSAPAVFRQGDAARIYELFIAKFQKYRPMDTEPEDWTSWLFHGATREIKMYRALRGFRLPGLLYLAPNVKVQGRGYREVPRNATLLVRTDPKMPNVIDVEFHGGQGEAEQVFCLTQRQWNSIASMLKECADVCTHEPRP